jgi:hypothetical protein
MERETIRPPGYQAVATAVDHATTQIRAISDFLDSMPPSCRINFPELNHEVCKKLSITIPNEIKLIDDLVHFVVSSRADLVVQRGRGIVKMPTP